VTYAELLARLQTLTQEQLAQTVTVYDVNDDETYGLQDCDVNGEEEEGCVGPQDTLDPGHFYLVRT
jgi:hypothetical protein